MLYILSYLKIRRE